MRTRIVLGSIVTLGLVATLGVAQAQTNCRATTSAFAPPAECLAAANAAPRGVANRPEGPGSTAYSWDSQNGPFYTVFDITVPEVLPNVAAFPAGGNFVGAGEWVNGMVYMLDGANNLYVVDPATGAINNTLAATSPGGSQSYSGMALDPTDGTVYVISTDIASSILFTIDLSTGTTTTVGTITNSPGNIGCAIDGNGDLWSYDIVNDSFIAIDKTTAAGTIVGPLGWDANFGQGMGWDSATDTLYIAGFNNATFVAELRIVDRSNGSSTVVGTLGGTTPGGLNQLSWLGFENLLFPDNAICNTGVGLAIPDNTAGGVTDTISIAPLPLNDHITDLDLIIQTTHTWVGDLSYTLTHVDTTTAVVPYDQPGVPASTFGCSGNNIDVNLNDEGVDGNVEDTCLTDPAITGDLVGGDPASTTLFEAFDGEGIAGDWALNVEDHAGGDSGTLDAWCLVPTLDTMPFLDGFESGDTSAWTFVVP